VTSTEFSSCESESTLLFNVDVAKLSSDASDDHNHNHISSIMMLPVKIISRNKMQVCIIKYSNSDVLSCTSCDV